jgi:hypothetical protein
MTPNESGITVVACGVATTLRLNDDAQTALDRLLSRRPGLSANELINQLLVEVDSASSHDERVEAAFAHGEDRWAAVLERLRTA